MASSPLNKLKTWLPFNNNNNHNANSPDGATRRNKKSKGFLASLEPDVGFQMTLVPNQHGRRDSAAGDNSNFSAAAVAVPELHVKIIGARHLPSLFGLKTVQGYVVKVKLFPGTLRYDSSIQTASWPTFNETFKFPMEPTTKSSFKSKVKPSNQTSDQTHSSLSASLPERLFKGHFLVLTVFALLELPAGTGNSIKHRLQQIRRKSSLLRSKSDEQSSSKNATANANTGDAAGDTPTKDIMQLTCSEQRRNIGSVTCFLDPRIFEENQRTGAFSTDEMWLALKDITVTSPSRTSNVPIANHAKGQVEILLQLCDQDVDSTGLSSSSRTISESSTQQQSPQKQPNASQTADPPRTPPRWSLGDMRRKLSISGNLSAVGRSPNTTKTPSGRLCLRIVTARMRCSIKVKEQFENMEHGTAMYIKTSVFEHDILSSSWKSDQFAPSLSVRWNPENCELRVPLNASADLRHVTVRTTIATKTKLGKKVVLGTVLLGGTASAATAVEQWSGVAETGNGGTAVSTWHAFE